MGGGPPPIPTPCVLWFCPQARPYVDGFVTTSAVKVSHMKWTARMCRQICTNHKRSTSDQENLCHEQQSSRVGSFAYYGFGIDYYVI